MRYSPVVLLASALFGATLLSAQFQPPSQQELQMTSDPKAPGASAVYLYVEEKTDDSVHYHSYYARVKVLTEKGKELATVRIPTSTARFRLPQYSAARSIPTGLSCR